MEYRGFRIERQEGTQIGHKRENSRSIGDRLGFNTHRKVTVWLVYDAEGRYLSTRDTLRDAKRYAEEY